VIEAFEVLLREPFPVMQTNLDTHLLNANYWLLTLDLSTALTAPEAIDTGTPLAAVACTTFII